MVPLNCPWCEGELQLSIQIRVMENRRWKCRSCGAFGYETPVTSAQLSDMYTRAWESQQSIDSEFAVGSTDSETSGSLIDVLMLPSLGLSANQSLLDYGAGKGELIRTLSQSHGGELKLSAYEPFGRELIIPDVDWVSNKEQLKEGSFDLIAAIEVIEHLTDPLAELKFIRSLLKSDGGQLIITTPNSNGVAACLGRFGWREVLNPTHLNLFSEKALKILLKRAGFTSISRSYEPIVYKRSKFAQTLLAFTQRLGVDGSLRMIARV